MLDPIVTCEHGGNRVPEEYQELFAGSEELLTSHRGWDPGALELGEALAERLGTPFFKADVTRLLVDLNRSLGQKTLFSNIALQLSFGARERILRAHYHPYRNRVEEEIAARINAGSTVVHLAMHTFTPVLDGVVRDVDIGLLYDPARVHEREYCGRLAASLRESRRDLRVRFNKPYRGTDDGFTTYLRRRHAASRYLGIEIEVNQRFVFGDPAEWSRLIEDLCRIIALQCGRVAMPVELPPPTMLVPADGVSP